MERKGILWTGRLLSVLPVLALLLSASMKLSGSAQVIAGFSGHYGYPAGALLGIAIAELGCALLYAIPRTAVLGVVLMTGYLGGAIATHVRASENFVPPLAVALVAWLGLFLRERRLWALLPLRRRAEDR